MMLGQVAQAVSAFIMAQAALKWPVDNHPGPADCVSSIDRVAAVLHALDEIERRPPPASPPREGS